MITVTPPSFQPQCTAAFSDLIWVLCLSIFSYFYLTFTSFLALNVMKADLVCPNNVLLKKDKAEVTSDHALRSMLKTVQINISHVTF